MDDLPLEDTRPAPNDNEVKSLTALAREQWRLEKLVENLRNQLKEAEEQLKNVAERELPGLMVELGVSRLDLGDGKVRLELKTEVYASITAERTEAAHDWLEEHGYADLITREFKVRFNAADEAWARKFQRDLKQRKRPLDVGLKRAVHPGRLNAWVRETLLAGVTLPEDLFGVYRRRVAKLTKVQRDVA